MKRIRINHNTQYTYSEPVSLLPHRLMLRPRAGHDIRIETADVVISVPHDLIWQRDIYGNSVGVVTFTEPVMELSITSEVLLQHFEVMPLNFHVDERAVMFPFHFDLSERVEMIPYQMPCFPSDSEAVRSWVQEFWRPGQMIETYVLLDTMNKAIAQGFTYGQREEPGVQRPAETLKLRGGSCRDFATLFIEGCRFFGLAARFVSGYLHSPLTVQNDGSTHAWAEVYLPGAGWKGFDTTSGLVTGHDHIAVAVTRHPADAPPIAGSFIGSAECQATMKVRVDVREW
ncbi:transglutaminase family protein [Rariglobus hedericola]|uniref:Transglutaminase family protein n=1 Tax=Rariglobus hedericola TaxID=2597822 RepID=A0A556QME0_9BACT|nr:transglutaminase family protein [Rariglobus hedericola]TSJ77819.1 transglutaminase family protein [Rariglobus hedericola]